MNTRIPRAGALRVLQVTMAAAMVYVVAGEVLQGWVGLHMDAWRARADFGQAAEITANRLHTRLPVGRVQPVV